MRVGIAGCGMIAGAPLRDGRPLATNHADACRRVAGVSLVAAADPSAERRQLFQEHWKVPSVYPTVHEMLARESLDVLIVATPTETHESLCTAALARGVRGILCEKPFTGNAAGAQRVLEAGERAGVPIAVNFMRRWDVSHRELLGMLQSGSLGTIRAAFGTYTGTLRGNGSHMIDTLEMLLPSAQPWSMHVASTLPATATDGPVSALLERGACRVLVTPIQDAAYFVFELTLVGTEGRARLLFGGNDIRIDHPQPSTAYPGYSYLEESTALPRDTLPDAFARALAGVVAAVRDGVPLAVPASKHVASLALVDDLVAAARGARTAAS